LIDTIISIGTCTRSTRTRENECLIKLWQRYDEGLLDIPSFLKAAELKYFQRPPKR
ncbi:unnamed protein product, partial [Rotaria magnacalcarata]